VRPVKQRSEFVTKRRQGAHRSVRSRSAQRGHTQPGTFRPRYGRERTRGVVPIRSTLAGRPGVARTNTLLGATSCVWYARSGALAHCQRSIVVPQPILIPTRAVVLLRAGKQKTISSSQRIYARELGTLGVPRTGLNRRF